jgi:hypothetical protein
MDILLLHDSLIVVCGRIYFYVLDDGNDLCCEEMIWNLLMSEPIPAVFIWRIVCFPKSRMR